MKWIAFLLIKLEFVFNDGINCYSTAMHSLAHFLMTQIIYSAFIHENIISTSSLCIIFNKIALYNFTKNIFKFTKL